MDYGFKVTTHGRALLAACAALEKPLTLTRAAVGSGTAEEGAELAEIHGLLHYEAEGAIAERRHEGDRLFLTVQYSNEGRSGGSFFLSEFMVFAQDPETGAETDLIYATLGDYRQGVPAYDPALPASLWNFPLIVVISDQVEVRVNASPGLITAEEFHKELEREAEKQSDALETHMRDPSAHANRRYVIAARVRDPSRPTYGLDGSGDGEDGGGGVALEVGPESGTAEFSAIVSGVAYDAKNMSSTAAGVPDGTLIVRPV